MSISSGSIGTTGVGGMIPSSVGGGGGGGTFLVSVPPGKLLASERAKLLQGEAFHPKIFAPDAVDLFRGIGVRADSDPEAYGTVEVGAVEAFVWGGAV